MAEGGGQIGDLYVREREQYITLSLERHLIISCSRCSTILYSWDSQQSVNVSFSSGFQNLLGYSCVSIQWPQPSKAERDGLLYGGLSICVTSCPCPSSCVMKHCCCRLATLTVPADNWETANAIRNRARNFYFILSFKRGSRDASPLACDASERGLWPGKIR